MLVRALDRFYTRLLKLKQLYPRADFSKRALQVVADATAAQCGHAYEHLTIKFSEELTNTRTALASDDGSATKGVNLFDILCTLETSLSEQVKSTLATLMAFMQPEVRFRNFSLFSLIEFCFSQLAFIRDSSRFQAKFVRCVREDVIVSFIRFVLDTVSEFSKSGK